MLARFNSLVVFIAACVSLVACSKADFSGSSGKGKAKSSRGAPVASDTAAPGDDPESAADPEGGEDPGSGTDASDGASPSGSSGPDATAVRECALAVGGEAVDVVTVTQGGAPLDLKPDSIIFLDVAGQADIKLAPQDIAAIKGLCIWAQGGATVKIETGFAVAGLYYYGRGNASTNIDFGTSGNLSKLSVNVAGGNSLAVDGALVDCAGLKLDSKSGSAQVSCKGQAL